MSASWCDALLEHRAGGRDELLVALDVVERREQADVAEPLARVLDGQPATLGQRVDHGVEPAGGGAGEQAAAGVGDGDVGEAGDVDVEHRARRAAARERAHHAERGEVDALELEAGVAARRRRAARPSRGGPRRPRRACARPAASRRVPSDWQSRTASSIGIGMWSGASTWTAAASAFGSSSGGRSSVRTTIRWLAMPSRTRLGSSCSAKMALSASASACGSATSPSRRTPGRSGATAPRLTEMVPLTWTSAAAMWLGSRSSPTTVAWSAAFS